MASPKIFDLQGKVAVVTGGNGGIGRGIALGLAQAGASIAILARNEEKNRAVLDEVKQHDVPVIAVPLDVTKRATLRPAMDEVEAKLGPIDILVNNAGISVQRGTLKLEAEAWDRVIETNLNSVFLLSQIAAVKGTPFYDEIITRTPAARFGEPEEMAGAAIFLASDASNFVTGEVVYVDGGFAIR